MKTKLIIVFLTIICSGFVFASDIKLEIKQKDKIDKIINIINSKNFNTIVNIYNKLVDKTAHINIKKSPELLYIIFKLDEVLQQKENETISLNLIKNLEINELSIESADKLYKNLFLTGNSEIKLIEYSDIQCLYCIKHHKNNTINDLKSIDKLEFDYLFIHFPLGFHEFAMSGAKITTCIGKTIGIKEYYLTLNNIFSWDEITNQKLNNLIKSYQKHTNDINKCILSKDTTRYINENADFGINEFNITGTPSTIILNSKNNKYLIISGSYPKQAFKLAIKKLLSE